MKNNYRSALLKACRLMGGQKQLAHCLHIDPSRLNKWINRGKQGVPYGYALAIEEVTKGEVSCFELIPQWEKIVEHCIKYCSRKENVSQKTVVLSCSDGSKEHQNENKVDEII